MHHKISRLVPRLSYDDFSYIVAVALERVCNWVKKPGEENNIKSDVEMSRVLGFATDWFRSNVRVILQYSVIIKSLSVHSADKGMVRKALKVPNLHI